MKSKSECTTDFNDFSVTHNQAPFGKMLLNMQQSDRSKFWNKQQNNKHNIFYRQKACLEITNENHCHILKIRFSKSEKSQFQKHFIMPL